MWSICNYACTMKLKLIESSRKNLRKAKKWEYDHYKHYKQVTRIYKDLQQCGDTIQTKSINKREHLHSASTKRHRVHGGGSGGRGPCSEV